jgi:predicted RNase H-like nuclease (RuvC/YqgF family)
VDKIVADENLIGSTESRLQRMDEAIDQLAIQRENLLGHYIRGQKLAIALCKNNYLKTCFRAFLRWKRYSQEYENMRLLEQLERTNQMIAELSAHVEKLEGINRNLLTENDELRQAAMDGIEIAKVVQELTKERENLSHDLADRAGTIKKLIEDNNNLSVRLNIAQREAQQLENMNQQVYMQPPGDNFR